MTTTTRALSVSTALAVALMSAPSRAAAPDEPEPATERDTPAQPDGDAEATEQDPELAKAMAHFAQGIALYEDGDFDGALFEFERAYASKPDYRLMYNIGVARLETNDYAGSKRAFTQYLDEGGDEIASDRRTEVRTQLQTLAARVGTLTIRCDHEGAAVSVDGEPIGVTPLAEPLMVNLGRRSVSVALAGFENHQETVEVGGGAMLAVDVTLTPLAQAAPVDATPAPASNGRRPLVIGAIVSSSVAVAVGGAAAATGVLALGQDDRVDRELGMFPADAGAVDQAAERRQQLALTTDVLIGVAAALAVTGVALGIAAAVKNRRRESGAQVSWTLTGVRGRF